MTACECPVAGYCQRHKVNKGSGWHKLCQAHEGYFQAWESGNGPGQKQKPDEERERRRQRIKEAGKRRGQLISWMRLLRLPQERGIGDTAARLLQQRKKSKPWVRSDAREAISCMLRECSCSRSDAVERLNSQYCY